jgi:hypothetical protein
MPQLLMELMRHELIETTMKLYVGQNTQATADVFWQAHDQQKAVSNTSSNNGQKQHAKSDGAFRCNPFPCLK